MIIKQEKYKHFNIVWIAETSLITSYITDNIADAMEDLVPSLADFCAQLNGLATTINKMVELRKSENTQRMLGDSK